MRRMYPRLVARARSAAAHGFAAVSVELPGAGDRPPLPGAKRARADLTRAIAAGEQPADEIDPRIAAAALFAGSHLPERTMHEARRVTIPLHVLLQWDDEGNDRARSLDLFDAFGSTQKTLHANMGGRTGVPQFAGDDATRFFVRHLVAARG